MAILKDVAALAEVSIAAVSLHINGKSQGRVSMETQQKIEQAIAEAGYVPSASSQAKHTEPAERRVKTVVIFWSIDFKRNLLGDFMGGIQTAILESSLEDDVDFVIRPYKSNEIYQHKRVLCGRQYHAILIANASLMDMQYLQSITPLIPVVLVNRVLKEYHGVYIDSARVGAQATELIKQQGYTRICTISSQTQYVAMNSRFLEFIKSCRERDITIPNEFQLITEDSITGGIEAAKEYLSYPERPNLIFASSDALAYGILKKLREQKVRVPEDCGIFSYGFERTDLTKHATPPLSVIDISTLSLARNSMALIIDILKKGITVPQHIEIPSSIVLRDSF